MNKVVALLVIVIMLSACGPKPDVAPAPSVDVGCVNDPKMTNEQIIDVTHLCEAAGLSAQALHCGDNFETTRIQCLPK